MAHASRRIMPIDLLDVELPQTSNLFLKTIICEVPQVEHNKASYAHAPPFLPSPFELKIHLNSLSETTLKLAEGTTSCSPTQDPRKFFIS